MLGKLFEISACSPRLTLASFREGYFEQRSVSLKYPAETKASALSGAFESRPGLLSVCFPITINYGPTMAPND